MVASAVLVPGLDEHEDLGLRVRVPWRGEPMSYLCVHVRDESVQFHPLSHCGSLGSSLLKPV
jgi:hypothetical protein